VLSSHSWKSLKQKNKNNFIYYNRLAYKIIKISLQIYHSLYHISKNISRAFWCATSGPRATSGPWRVVMWPAVSSRKIGTDIKIESLLWFSNILMLLTRKFKTRTVLDLISSFMSQHSRWNRSCSNSQQAIRMLCSFPYSPVIDALAFWFKIIRMLKKNYRCLPLWNSVSAQCGH